MKKQKQTKEEKMKFKDFYKYFNEETVEVFKDNPKVEEVQQQIVSAWMVHKTIETNRRLIWATWSLAIATIILSIINLIIE